VSWSTLRRVVGCSASYRHPHEDEDERQHEEVTPSQRDMSVLLFPSNPFPIPPFPLLQKRLPRRETQASPRSCEKDHFRAHICTLINTVRTLSPSPSALLTNPHSPHAETLLTNQKPFPRFHQSALPSSCMRLGLAWAIHEGPYFPMTPGGVM